MPRLIDHPSQLDAVVDAVAELIVEGGVHAATLRGVARRSRVSSGVLVENWGGRDRMLAIAAHHYCRRWQADLWRRCESGGPVRLIPRDGTELEAARVWFALAELGATIDRIRATIEDHRLEERQMLDVLTGQSWPEADLDLLVAAATGLRHELCGRSPEVPGSSDEAPAPDYERAARAFESFLVRAGTLAPDPAAESKGNVGS